MNALSRLVLAAVLPVSSAIAQDADAEVRAPAWRAVELPQHLASDDLAEVAWAGYLVQRDHVRAAVSAVLAALDRLVGRDDVPGQLARLQLFDVLIQLQVKVPGERILPHVVGFLRVPALVLAAACPEVNADYLAARFSALAKSRDGEWLACGNLLAAQHDPRFVARCLREVPFVIEVTVVDGKPGGIGVG